MIELFKKTKTGKIQVYRSWTEGADIVTEYGEKGGKMQTSRVTAIGKNIGKSNETTPEEQAVLQMHSKAQQKKDKGYFETVEDAKTEEVFLPMLAKDGRKVKITYPCDAQPKLDGVRCMATADRLMSRGGKEYDVQHIKDSLPSHTTPKVVFDGEIYIHGNSLQNTVSLVKKPKPGSEKLQYWVYDMYFPDAPNMPWSRRKNYMKLMMPHLASEHIEIVETVQVNNEAEMLRLHGKDVEQGYEGIILRHPEGTYTLGHRSSSLIKYKEFIDDEFQIVGYKEGVGKFQGCVIWTCEVPDVGTFDVVPKGTLEMKQKWYKEANDIVGKDLTVRFQAYTDDGLPQFPVGIALRDYEN